MNKLNKILKDGYCIIENALNNKELYLIRKRLDEQAECETKLKIAYNEGGTSNSWGNFKNKFGEIDEKNFINNNNCQNQRIFMLVNKGSIFIKMLKNKKIRSVIDNLLGEDYLLSSHGANIARFNNNKMKLHTDQWWMPNPMLETDKLMPVGSINRDNVYYFEKKTSSISPPVAYNVVWMIDDFTKKNGATRIVPKSHLRGTQPDSDSEAIAVTGKCGSALIIDGRLWHGTGTNKTNQQRRAILTTFCGPQFRPQENYTIGLDEKIYDTIDDDIKSLLGYKVWNAYGRIGNPTVDIIDKNKEYLGELYLNNLDNI